jgi:hypothetical protein
MYQGIRSTQPTVSAFSTLTALGASPRLLLRALRRWPVVSLAARMGCATALRTRFGIATGVVSWSRIAEAQPLGPLVKAMSFTIGAFSQTRLTSDAWIAITMKRDEDAAM